MFKTERVIISALLDVLSDSAGIPPDVGSLTCVRLRDGHDTDCDDAGIQFDGQCFACKVFTGLRIADEALDVIAEREFGREPGLIETLGPSARATHVPPLHDWNRNGRPRTIVIGGSAITKAGVTEGYTHKALHNLIEAVQFVEMTRPDSAARVDAAKELAMALEAYERTGDHDHGRGPIKLGGTCDGGDCWVTKGRETLRVACGHAVWASDDGITQRCVRCNYPAVRS